MGGVAFRASSTAGGAAETSIVLTRPPGTLPGDFLVAALAVRTTTTQATTVIAVDAPSGWVQLARSDNPNGNPSALVVFTHAVGPAEGPTDRFTMTCACTLRSTVIGVAAFSGVDLVNPINAHAIIAVSPETVDFPTPSVTTTVPDTLALALYSIASPQTWSAPPGLTEVVDVQNDGVSLGLAHQPRPMEGPIASVTAHAEVIAEADTGNTMMLALTPTTLADGGTESDGGQVDGGGGAGSDAGTDAGSAVLDGGDDAGAPDSGSGLDGGMTVNSATGSGGGSDPAAVAYSVGCNCQALGGTVLAMLGVALLWRKRRCARSAVREPDGEN